MQQELPKGGEVESSREPLAMPPVVNDPHVITKREKTTCNLLYSKGRKDYIAHVSWMQAFCQHMCYLLNVWPYILKLSYCSALWNLMHNGCDKRLIQHKAELIAL